MSNDSRQYDTTRVQRETKRQLTSTTRHNTSKTRIQHKYNVTQHETTQHNTSKEARAAKIGFHFALFVAELYIFSIFLEIVNIVLHVIWFQPFEYQGLIILLSEILNNQVHMTSCAKLSDLLEMKLKIAIQLPKTYIYPLFFRVLSINTMASEI